ncbi:hypothetical protein DXG03_000734 [Asterophora parasitica]|uniref:FAD dependent oxidoreductase domain-containing protein n=1 Tax=Asterophora parasitica TaxID=117018 RepID=A0A9P7G4P4_9AGAR|nr:hypothetical protein DXG03_000734 [Asterophora parasitica]
MCSLSTPILQEAAAQATLELPTLKGPAGLPVPNSTHSFWINTAGANPLAKEGSGGNLTRDADVCIIGAGITGVSAAYHFAKHFGTLEDGKALKAVILEARDFSDNGYRFRGDRFACLLFRRLRAHECPGRNGGHLTPQPFNHFVEQAKVFGTKEAKKIHAIEHYTADELLKIIETQGLQSAVDLVASDHVALLVTEKEVHNAKASYEAAKAAGANVDGVKWLSVADVKERYGATYPAYAHEGHNLWPLKLVTELHHLARTVNPSKFQVSLHTNTPVTSLHSLEQTSTSYLGRRWSLATPRGAVHCSYVIHATNAYASHLLPHMSGPSGIIPTRGQVLALRAAAPQKEITTASWSGNQGFEYWFPRPTNGSENPLIILGGGREASGPDFETYVVDDSVVRKEVGKSLRGFLPGVFPGKFEKGRKPEMEWTGIMGYTKIGDPFVGRVLTPDGSSQVPGQYISAGYTGHGMPRAYACAEVVVGMIATDIAGETWTAPDWLPRHFLTTERPQ